MTTLLLALLGGVTVGYAYGRWQDWRLMRRLNAQPWWPPMSTTPPTTTTPPKLRPGQMEIGRRQPGDTDVFLRKGQP